MWLALYEPRTFAALLARILPYYIRLSMCRKKKLACRRPFFGARGTGRLS
jgi:hypothetical protein